MTLDIRTVLVMMLLSNLLMACVLGITFAGRFHDGLKKWTVSLCLVSLSWLTLFFRGVLPDAPIIMLSNGLAAFGLALQVSALLEFHRRRTPRWLFTLPLLVGAVFYPLASNAAARMLLSGCLFGPALIGTGIAVNRFAAATPRTRYVLTGSFLLAGAIILLRGLLIFFDPALSTGTTPQGWPGTMLVVGFAANIGCSFGFLLMHQERYEAEMLRLATTDSLTGVFNRRTFFDLAERELSRTRRVGAPLSLLLLDLDHFKTVNDSYGHAAGDSVLVAFSLLIQKNLRREDLVMRYGGEEFCVLLPGVDQTGAGHLAERMRAQTAEMRAASEPRAAVTVSIGIAVSHGQPPDRLEDLLARADEALYLAKHGGRDRIVVAAGGEPAAPV